MRLKVIKVVKKLEVMVVIKKVNVLKAIMYNKKVYNKNHNKIRRRNI